MTRCLSLALLPAVLAGCATTYGSDTIRGARFDYNEAVVRSWNEQLLLNLVRLRYRDTPLFLDVTGVVSQYTFDANASALATVKPGPDQNVWEFGAGAGYTERPTISYAPLQGQDFVKRLLSPIPPDTIIMLAQSGWSVERLLLACAREVNGIVNARGAGGPTPGSPPEFEEFQELVKLLRKLQIRQVLDVKLDPRSETLGTYLVVRPGLDAEERADLDRLRKVLGLDPSATRYRIVPSSLARSPDEFEVVGRSVLGVMYYLSQAVEPPAEHEAEGKVTVTRDATGGEFDWRRVVGPLLRICSSASAPGDAFVAVEYRDHWFYIRDDDLNSKSTFGLLTQLFSLQSATGVSSGPLLTIPTGG
jgi:hypothetical protein